MKRKHLLLFLLPLLLTSCETIGPTVKLGNKVKWLRKLDSSDLESVAMDISGIATDPSSVNYTDFIYQAGSITTFLEDMQESTVKRSLRLYRDRLSGGQIRTYTFSGAKDTNSLSVQNHFVELGIGIFKVETLPSFPSYEKRVYRLSNEGSGNAIVTNALSNEVIEGFQNIMQNVMWVKDQGEEYVGVSAQFNVDYLGRNFDIYSPQELGYHDYMTSTYTRFKVEGEKDFSPLFV